MKQKIKIMKLAAKKISIVTFIGILVFFSSVVFIPSATAQGFKVGYVDPRTILQRMPEAKAVQQRIQNLYDRKQNEIAGMQQELQLALQEYQQKAGVISEEARLDEEGRLTQMDLEFRQIQSDAEQELQQESAELMEPLFEQIQLSVDHVAEQQGLDMIFNVTMGGYSNLDRNIIYVSPEHQSQYDITAAVMEDLGI